MLLACTVLVLILYIIYSWIVRKHEYWSRFGIPTLKPTFLFGNMAPVIFRKIHMCKNVERCYKHFKHRGYGGFYEFLNPIFMPTNPDIIREIFVKHSDHFMDRRTIANDSTDPLLGRSLLNLRGYKWRSMRHRLSPAFTSSKLRGMFPLIENCGLQFTEYLLNRNHDAPLEFKQAFTKLTNDIIATVAFGHECNAIKNPDETFYKLGQQLQDINFKRVLTVFGHLTMPKLMKLLDIPFMPKEPIEYFRGMILNTLKHREENKQHRPDMLQLLMEAQKGSLKNDGPMDDKDSTEEIHEEAEKAAIEDDDIAAQAFLFFLAGFDTVATALAFLAHELAVNPEIQEKLYDEIDSILERNDGKLTYDTVLSMRYLDMVVSETLRKYPPAIFTDRQCTSSFLIPKTDIVIDKGTAVMLPIYALHHDPEYYPEPNIFDPERFNDENRKKMLQYTYLPFGTGPHNCLGIRLALLEIKVCVCLMLAACELRVCSRSQVPLQISSKTFAMTTDAGFWLNTAPRNKTVM